MLSPQDLKHPLFWQVLLGAALTLLVVAPTLYFLLKAALAG